MNSLPKQMLAPYVARQKHQTRKKETQEVIAK
jgi:hypothetical protein